MWPESEEHDLSVPWTVIPPQQQVTTTDGTPLAVPPDAVVYAPGEAWPWWYHAPDGTCQPVQLEQSLPEDAPPGAVVSLVWHTGEVVHANSFVRTDQGWQPLVDDPRALPPDWPSTP